MAGAACKIIINQGTRAMSESMAEVLRMPVVVQKIGPEKMHELTQRLADIDIVAVHGCTPELAMPDGGLLGVAKALYDLGIFTDDVRKVLPGFP